MKQIRRKNNESTWELLAEILVDVRVPHPQYPLALDPKESKRNPTFSKISYFCCTHSSYLLFTPGSLSSRSSAPMESEHYYFMFNLLAYQENWSNVCISIRFMSRLFFICVFVQKLIQDLPRHSKWILLAFCINLDSTLHLKKGLDSSLSSVIQSINLSKF